MTTATERAAKTRWQARRRKLEALGQWESPLVDPARAIAHTEHLRATYGISYEAIEMLGGVTPTYLEQICNPRHVRHPEKITRHTEARILAVQFDLDRLGDKQLVNAAGTARRLQALNRIGYPIRDIAARLGAYSDRSVAGYMGQRFVTAAVARRVRDLYDELSMTPGPSSRARAEAARKGYQPPLAWDDDTIDDPSTRPDLGEGAPKRPNGGSGRPAEYVVEDVEWYLEQVNRYATPKELTVRLGYSEPNSLYMALMRAGRDDLRDVLIRNGVADGSHGDLEKSVARRKGRAA